MEVVVNFQAVKGLSLNKVKLAVSAASDSFVHPWWHNNCLVGFLWIKACPCRMMLGHHWWLRLQMLIACGIKERWYSRLDYITLEINVIQWIIWGANIISLVEIFLILKRWPGYLNNFGHKVPGQEVPELLGNKLLIGCSLNLFP